MTSPKITFEYNPTPFQHQQSAFISPAQNYPGLGFPFHNTYQFNTYTSVNLPLCASVALILFSGHQTKMFPKLYMIPPSPPVRAVLCTANALGVNLELVQVNLREGEHLTPEFTKVSDNNYKKKKIISSSI